MFGTDGVRGSANRFPITADNILRLAQALGVFARRGEHLHRIVIGKDTRLSGYMLEPALASGLVSVGCDVALTGPLPTPAIAMLTKSLRADLGIMISASHNPYCDNGIKIFRPDGLKLSREEEAEIENLVHNPDKLTLVNPENLGRAERLDSARGRYIEYIKNTFPADLSLEGLKIVVDCAHGAAYKIAPAVLYELGAEVIAIGVEPDGRNINHECGVVSPQALIQTICDNDADLGIALDGDADRLVLCDSQGRLFNGDKILAIIAAYYHRQNRIKGAIIGTVMANLGLELFLQSLGLTLIRTGVGDRQVLTGMLKQHSNLGGEQSGHIIIGDYGHVGDGLLAALQVLAAGLRSHKRIDELYDIFSEVPQKTINIPLRGEIGGDELLQSPAVDAAVSKARQAMGEHGRVVARSSGTEPVIRLMGEAHNGELLSEVLGDLQNFIQNSIIVTK